MKLFVVVVMLVVGPLVFATDIVWKTGWPESVAPWSSPQAGGETPQGQLVGDSQEETAVQTYNEHTDNRPFLGDQQDTRPRQSSGQQTDQGNEWWRWLMGGAYLTGVGVFMGLARLYQGWRKAPPRN
jgi:hypothetical protein